MLGQTKPSNLSKITEIFLSEFHSCSQILWNKHLLFMVIAKEIEKDLKKKQEEIHVS